MRENNITSNTFQKNNGTPDLLLYREKAKESNLTSEFSKKMIKLFSCPICKQNYKIIGDYLICGNGHKIPIINGSPDFVVLSDTAMEEKHSQSNFHDNEEINETFAEIVLRPNWPKSNYIHKKSWMYHLDYLKKKYQKKLVLN